MYTQIVECVLGVPFGYGFNEEVRRLLEDFRDMVNFCIGYAYGRGGGDGIILLISATLPVR